MKTIKVLKSTLLGAIKENRSHHATEWETALSGWRKEAAESIATNIDTLTLDLGAMRSPSSLPKDFKLHDLKRLDQMPVNHLDEYDRAIQMLTMHMDDSIELEEGEFRQYVQDEWEWKNVFNIMNSKYLAHA